MIILQSNLSMVVSDLWWQFTLESNLKGKGIVLYGVHLLKKKKIIRNIL